MNIGYGFNRTEEDLKAAGAERVWIDTRREREMRAELLQYGLREGDTLILLSRNDLGGSSRANKRMEAEIEKIGASIEIVAPPKENGQAGRPRKFSPDEWQDEDIRELWLNPIYTEQYKLQQISKRMGRAISKGQLWYRYGSMKNPK